MLHRTTHTPAEVNGYDDARNGSSHCIGPKKERRHCLCVFVVCVVSLFVRLFICLLACLFVCLILFSFVYFLVSMLFDDRCSSKCQNIPTQFQKSRSCYSVCSNHFQNIHKHFENIDQFDGLTWPNTSTMFFLFY